MDNQSRLSQNLWHAMAVEHAPSKLLQADHREARAYACGAPERAEICKALTLGSLWTAAGDFKNEA
jgi:hypothetical protein